MRPSYSEYEGQYPLAGDVAVLCEGDLVGYEATLLRRWFDIRLRAKPLVDVWACGTGDALAGFCDAVGRARPIIVIGDRDYRSLDESLQDSNRCKKDRVDRRGLRVAEWRCWHLNEIENYFLEPSICVPVMMDVFSCSEAEVIQALSDVVESLAVLQSTQFVLYRLRRDWRGSDTAPQLANNLLCRPRWGAEEPRISPPNHDAVVGTLQDNWEQWKARAADGTSHHDVPREFSERYDDWRGVHVEHETWRTDWAGKEVLRYLRDLLASRFGWPPNRPGGVEWHLMNKKAADAIDREIERTIKPYLVAGFTDYLLREEPNSIRSEWWDIAGLPQDAVSRAYE